MLAALHALCGVGVALLGRPRGETSSPTPSSSSRGRLFESGLLTRRPTSAPSG